MIGYEDGALGEGSMWKPKDDLSPLELAALRAVHARNLVSPANPDEQAVIDELERKRMIFQTHKTGPFEITANGYCHLEVAESENPFHCDICDIYERPLRAV